MEWDDVKNKIKEKDGKSSIHFHSFFSFLDNEEYRIKCSSIYQALSSIENKKSHVYYILKSVFDKKTSVQFFSILLFKSLSKINITTGIKNITFINSDIAISNIYDYLNRFRLYYESSNIENIYLVKREIFAVLEHLCISGCVSTDIIRTGVKTIKNYSLLLGNIIISDFDQLNVSFTPFTLTIIEGKTYIIGDFFTKVYEVFRENIYSLKRFNLRDTRYLEKIAKLKIYINAKDLERIIATIEDSTQIRLKTIPELIKKKNAILAENLEKIKTIKDKHKAEFNKDLIDLVVAEHKTINSTIMPDEITVCIYYLINYLAQNTEISNAIQKYGADIDGFKFITELQKICVKEGVTTENSDLKKILEKIIHLKDQTLFKIIKKNINIIQGISGEKIKKKTIISDWSLILKFILRFSKNSLEFKKYFSKLELKTHVYEQENKKLYGDISHLRIFYNFSIIKTFIKDEQNLIYLPFFFDFRGRFYYNSPVGPTASKYSRFLYNYGIYGEEEINEGVYDEKIINLIDSQKKYITLCKGHLNITRNSQRIDIGIFWLLFAIGACLIEKNKARTHVSEFMNRGYSYLINNEQITNIEKKIETNYYKNILTSLNDKKIIKRIIHKDATASFMQQLVRLLGHASDLSLELVNLNHKDSWMDPYSFILIEWKKKHFFPNQNLEKIFTRKTVKKTIMTNPYAAKYPTAWSYFKESVLSNFNIQLLNNSEEEEAFKDFYNYISNDIESVFLKNKSKAILDKIKNDLQQSVKQIILKTDESCTDIIYFKLKDKSFDIILNIPKTRIKKRVTKRFEVVDTLSIDYKKIAQAVRANWIHYIDAMLVRDINRKSKQVYLSIHDCLLIDFLYISEFIVLANEESNKHIFQETGWNNIEVYRKNFSPFIFL